MPRRHDTPSRFALRSRLLVHLLAGVGLMLAASLAPAQDVKAPTPKPAPGAIVDSGPRCQPQAVNECRAVCDKKSYEPKSGQPVHLQLSECKQSCVRGC